MSEQNEKNVELVSIEASVMPQTAAALQKLSHDADLTVGEVIDRLSLRMTAHNVDYAVKLANEEVMTCLSGLSHDDFQVGYEQLVLNLAAALSPEKLQSVVEKAQAQQEAMMKGLADLPQEERDAIKAALEKMVAQEKADAAEKN